MSTVQGALTAADRERLRALAGVDDPALGARLLASVPTNESRSSADLLRFAARADAFGRDLADGTAIDVATVEVVERSGGLPAGGLLARYGSRGHRVELFSDTIGFCEDLVDELGWRALFPTGSVRAAAVAHEHAHHLVVADRSRALRTALDHPVSRIGRLRRLGFVAGTDEVAAHAFAARTLRLERSPLLLTAAATAALDVRNGARASRTSKEN
ncbi:hypothetical protein [Curtobacterium sp. MCBD17_003]|uniref:hypothetical protein n=1 Tax=Curtobacterium sp. MCBD17_003 TaxID=2175667 RepID=UPI000DAAB2A8|nr:hypothetical protein [Curtobacterium sp. MCBD17_003]WIE55634.1 hypothetical protein DEI88_005390 [Curtobacterium sp. MCBD17_003]